MLLDFFLHLLVLSLAYYIWKTLSGLDSEDDDILPSTTTPASPVVGPRLLARIEEACQRMNEQDLLFLSRQLAHKDNDVAIFTARCLSVSTNPRAAQLMFEHIARLDLEIKAKQHQKKLQNMDFYQRLAEEAVSEPHQKMDRGLDWLDKALHFDNYSLIHKYLPASETTLNSEGAHRALIKMLEQGVESPEFLYHALISLKGHVSPPPIQLVDRYMRSSNPLLKRAAIDVAGLFGMKSLIPRIEIDLLSLNPGVTIEATYALVALDSKSSVKKIELNLKHRNPMVRDTSRWALKTLSPLQPHKQGNKPNQATT
jgi:hypothetical protein